VTLAELRAKTLKKLRVLAPSQTAPAYADEIVEDAYDAIYEQLKAEKLVYWGAADDVPANLAYQIIALVIFNCADDFHVPESRLSRLERQSLVAMKDIRRKTTQGYVPTTAEVDYY
jgi:hypothetical protein